MFLEACLSGVDFIPIQTLDFINFRCGLGTESLACTMLGLKGKKGVWEILALCGARKLVLDGRLYSRLKPGQTPFS